LDIQTRCGSAVITSLSAIISTDCAVVRYKPNADKRSAGEWFELEFREDLPKAQEKSSAPPAAANGSDSILDVFGCTHFTRGRKFRVLYPNQLWPNVRTNCSYCARRLGIPRRTKGNAIALARKPTYDALLKNS